MLRKLTSRDHVLNSRDLDQGLNKHWYYKEKFHYDPLLGLKWFETDTFHSIKHRRSWDTDGNRKSNLSFFWRGFAPHHGQEKLGLLMTVAWRYKRDGVKTLQKGKKFNFRGPSVVQKRLCLSSLVIPTKVLYLTLSLTFLEVWPEMQTNEMHEL